MSQEEDMKTAVKLLAEKGSDIVRTVGQSLEDFRKDVVQMIGKKALEKEFVHAETMIDALQEDIANFGPAGNDLERLLAYQKTARLIRILLKKPSKQCPLNIQDSPPERSN